MNRSINSKKGVVQLYTQQRYWHTHEEMYKEHAPPGARLYQIRFNEKYQFSVDFSIVAQYEK